MRTTVQHSRHAAAKRGITLAGEYRAYHAANSFRQTCHIRRRFSGLSSAEFRARSNCSASPLLNSHPVLPLLTRSRAAPQSLLAITGVPTAKASVTTIPCGSYTDGSTNNSLWAISGGMSAGATAPKKRMLPACCDRSAASFSNPCFSEACELLKIAPRLPCEYL